MGWQDAPLAGQAPESSASGWQSAPVTAAGKFQADPKILGQKQTYWVSPDNYLSLVPPLDKPWEDAQGRSLKKSTDAGEAIDEAPWLEIKDGKLADYDGRHRALLAKEQGVDLIPV